jgi:N-acetylmuramoyl-L-alanine amidase
MSNHRFLRGVRPRRARRSGMSALGLWVWGAVAVLPLADSARADARPIDRFDTVVIDAGHGGHDDGAKGPAGTLEKDVVLGVSKDLAAALRKRGLRVVMTRESDDFVSLERRTYIANDARADLFISIHANAADSARIHGVETFFMSLSASDDAAARLAARENEAFGDADTLPAVTDDPVLGILGDLIEAEHLEESQEFARMAQAHLAGAAAKDSRGVKQAPFVVLAGVQMPAALVEIGFITHPSEEKAFRSRKGRGAIVFALENAVAEFQRRYDARHAARGAPAQVER